MKKNHLSPYLSKNLVQVVNEFNKLNTADDVARLLEIPLAQLIHILYKTHHTKRYNSFEIPKKSGGLRVIRAPIGGTRILQEKLSTILNSSYSAKEYVHGFVKDKSVVTNAKSHKKMKYVFNIDLEDFYGSINFGRVRGLFIAKPFSLGPNAATLLAQICIFENSLPQGSPVSPVISNYIAANLDKKLSNLARHHGLKYTRYADDITFSSSKKSFPSSLADYEGDNPVTSKIIVGKQLEDLIESAGFKINHNKVRIQIASIRQEVTGLTVNNFINVKRTYIRKIRAMLFAWDKFGLISAEREYIQKYAKSPPNIETENLNGSYFKNVIYGRLAYLKMVRGEDDDIYRRLCLRASSLDDDPPKKIKELTQMYEEYDVFICHASEDKEKVAQPIFNACQSMGIKAFIDTAYIAWGDSLTEKINHALGNSKFVLVILSENSLGKAWPSSELNSAIAREIAGKQKVLPLIVGRPNLSAVSLIEDKLRITWENDSNDIAARIKELLN